MKSESDGNVGESNPYTITEEYLTEQLKKENSGRYSTQIYATITASLGSLSFGAAVGWSNPIFYQTDKIRHHILNVNQQSWLASVVPLGASVGIITWAYFNQRYGPKKTMLLQAPLNIISWLIVAQITETNGYIAGRFFCGFLSVSYMVCGECLLIDSVHQKKLRHLFVIYQSSFLLGVLITWLMVQLLDDTLATSICAIFCAIHALLLIYLPESPVYLYDKSPLKAEKSLTWYRGHNRIYTEMRNIKQYSEMRKIDPQATNSMLYSKVVIKAILIVLGIKFFSISSGYYIFLFYNVDMIQGFVIDDVNRNHLYDTMIYGLLMYICNFVSMIIHYRATYPIKIPLILSSVAVTLVLTAFTYFLYLGNKNEEMDKYLQRLIPIICVSLLAPAYEIGLSCYAEIALIDYVPNEVYARARNILKIWHWFLVFLFVKTVIIVREYAPHNFACILLLALFSFIGILYMVCVVVETKGKSLIEVQRSIGGNPIGTRGRLTKHARHLTVITADNC